MTQAIQCEMSRGSQVVLRGHGKLLLPEDAFFYLDARWLQKTSCVLPDNSHRLPHDFALTCRDGWLTFWKVSPSEALRGP